MAEPPPTPAQLPTKFEFQFSKIALTNNARDEPEATPGPTTFHKFGNLPVELKEKVYEYVFEDRNYVHNPPRFGKSTHWPRLPALCYTSKLEYKISTPVLLRTIGIRLHKEIDVGVMENWLKSISSPGKNRRAAIKKADLWYDSHRQWPGFAKEIQFLSKCGELQEITIVIGRTAWAVVASSHFIRHDWHASPKEPTGTMLVEEVGLTRLRSCLNLKHMRILVPGLRLSYEDELEGEAMYADQVAEWLKNDYMSSRSRSIDVQLVCMDWQNHLKEVAIGQSAD